jgi:hypothetical protein
MATDNQNMRYNVSTHSQFSHNYVIALLSSNDVQYRVEYIHNEEVYSRFEIISSVDVFKLIRDLAQENNNGTSISIEYGSY